VPGLAAKPVIDMLAPVRSLTGAQDAVAPLTEDGWLFWPDDPDLVDYGGAGGVQGQAALMQP
jgi:GrpB-like predicted nucleotidyltransferase (UPF0157 family)